MFLGLLLIHIKRLIFKNHSIFKVRLYDIEKADCFVSPVNADQHDALVTDIKYYENGSYYVTASHDKSIKVWDGRTGRCINTFDNCHSNRLDHIDFTRNDKVITALVNFYRCQ